MNPPPVALLVAAGAAQRLLARRSSSTPTSRSVAALIGAMSIGVLAAPVLEFRRQQTTVDPRAGATPSHLVLTGANAFTRNPAYLGMAGLLLANAAVRPKAAALLPLLGFTAWIDRRQIPAEGRALRERFDEEYETYRARVPRWIGPRPSAR